MTQAIKLSAQLVTGRGKKWRGLVVKEKCVSALQGPYSFHSVTPTCLTQLQTSGSLLML